MTHCTFGHLSQRNDRNVYKLFMVALSVITPSGGKARHPSVSEWLSQLWYSHQDYYSARRRNEVDVHSRLSRLQGVVQSEDQLISEHLHEIAE